MIKTAWINQRTVSVAGLLFALVAGAMVVRQPAFAALLAVVVLGVVSLAILGRRAFAAGIVFVACAPWYPFVSDAAVAPRIPERTLCFVIAAGATVPWLWSLAWGVRRTPPSPLIMLYGLLLGSLTIMMYVSFNGLHDMFSQATFGYLFGIASFLLARRFATTRAWAAPAFWGVIGLILLGLAAYASAPGSRVGFFTGYPITYGAIVAGLTPLAVLHANRRSRTLALGLALAVAGLLVLSQSRSSWVAVCALLLIVVVLLMRLGRWREVRALAAVTLVGLVGVVQTGSLHKIVEERLSSDVVASDSVTHRQWSIDFAKQQLRERPIFGAGTPGYAGNLAADETDIGAVDNGYLSIGIDLGLLGLLAAVVPIAVAVNRLVRWLWYALEPPEEDLALALGIIAIGVVTAFYDSFYWMQLCLLLGGMGGTLSARTIVTAEGRARMRARRRRRRRSRAALPIRAGR